MESELKPVTPLTGFQILSFPLPELLTRANFQTSSIAFHMMHYNGPLALWPIESEARDIVSRENLNTDCLAASVRGVSKHPCFIDREHYLCGDELSVCGRFVQNALGPATAVAFANGIKARFGDFKVCAEAAESTKSEKRENKSTGEAKAKGRKMYIPDFVGVRCDALSSLELKGVTQPVMILVGEAKTPWRHANPKC